MKLITYMMQYLTSILSLGSSSKPTSKSDLEKRIEELESRIETHEASINEMAFCIQQIASSISTIMNHATSQARDPLDELLEKSGTDDDGSGYLH